MPDAISVISSQYLGASILATLHPPPMSQTNNKMKHSGAGGAEGNGEPPILKITFSKQSCPLILSLKIDF